MRRSILLLVLPVGILGGGFPVIAQTAVPPSTTIPKYEETVVVSASLDSEDRADVPASVTVIDKDELEARQVYTLSEAISTVPGLTIAQAGPPGQQTSLFVRGAESEQTLLLWNGIPLNDPYFGGANWQFVQTDGVERIEVARGPFSALYGSSAIGGVVQVFTGSRQGGTFNAEAGADGYYRGGLAAGTDLGRLRLDVTGSLRRGDGELENSFYDSDEVVANGAWTFRPGVSLGLMARSNDSKSGLPISSGEPNPVGDISWKERELAIPFRADLGTWEVEALVSQTHFDSAFRDADDPFGFTASDTESEGLRGRTVVTWRHPGDGDDLWIAFGSEAERLEVTSSSTFGSNLDGSHQRTWALFGQGSWGHGPVRLDLGVRRDDNDVYGGETSLRSGVVLDAGAGVRVRASYGEAFRAPSLGELFFPSTGNPDLQPEDSASFELGIEHEANGWRVALTGFENRQRNLIDFDFVNFRNINVGRARSRGVEAEVGVRRGIFDARWNATWLEAKDRTSDLDLLRRPEKSSNLVLSVRPGDWTLNVEGRYVGERPDVDPFTFGRTTNPDYLRVDLAARWKALSWLSPYARLENVADEEYQEILGYPAPGRTLIGGVAVEF